MDTQHDKIKNALVRLGAKVQPNPFGNELLLIAVGRGNEEIAKMLLHEGADINAVDKLVGLSALHTAVQWDMHDMVQFLLDAGADPNVLNDRGQTALEMSREPRIKAKKAEKLLLEYQARSND